MINPGGYKIKKQNAMYFLTLNVVDWVDVFTSKKNVAIVILKNQH